MANANGGIIYIGKDDKGNVIGINNAVKLVKEQDFLRMTMQT